MSYDLDLPDLREAVLDTIRANGYTACYIRPLLYRGYHELGVNPFQCPVEAAILLWEWGAYLGEDALEKGVDVQVSSWARPAANTFPAMSKSTANYANSQLIKMEATLNGYSEGIALDPSGLVSEGSGQNIFVVRDEHRDFTPPMSGSVLPGITRDVVMTLARELDLPMREQPIPREMLYIADEVFFTGTAAEISPIRSIDKITIGAGTRGPVTTAIQRRFFDVINGNIPGHARLAHLRVPGTYVGAAARAGRDRQDLLSAADPPAGMDITDLLAAAVQAGASDLHLKSGNYPMTAGGRHTEPDRRGPADSTRPCWRRWPPRCCPRRSIRAWRASMRWTSPTASAGLGRFRCNVFRQRGTIAMVLRVIPLQVRSIDDLDLPPVLQDDRRRGTRPHPADRYHRLAARAPRLQRWSTISTAPAPPTS